MTKRTAAVTLLALLLFVAWLSPDPNRVTDRQIYERTAAQVIVPDCSDLQCFRVLVPWVLGRLPGGSTLRWKGYAALANAAGAFGVWALSLTFGLSRRAALMAAAISAVGFGSLYTLHDPFTSDPLMYALGPWITDWLLTDRVALAAIAGIVGVLAKEFAAAPLYAFALSQALERRWVQALRALAGGNAAFIMWALVTIVLMLRFNYGWGWNGIGSANLTGGAALALWAEKQTPRGIASAMFNEFGAVYLLAPVGFFIATAGMRRLALVSLPIAALFAYVQQPDRALWNFHYLAAPLAALPLERAGAAVAWSTIALFAIGNLRVGAQLPIAPYSHLAILGSLALACVCDVTAWRVPRLHSGGPVQVAGVTAK